MEIVYIVIFAAITLFLLVIIDKRKAILNFFKTKVFKPKEVKVPKPKNTIDTDTFVDTSQLKYEPLPQINKDDLKTNQTETIDKKGNLFDYSEELDEDNIDLDLLYEKLQREQSEKLSKKLQEELLDDNDLPDFDSMSINDLDDLLESNLAGSDYSNPYFGTEENLTGAELGEVIKKLPKRIKIIIISDIFKTKF